MSRRDLDAAGITDPALRASYEHCRRLNARHGRTYYLATLLLPPARRPAVHALYGFARYADEVVDDPTSTLSPSEKLAVLGSSWDELPVGAAMTDTFRRYDIDPATVADFLAAMTMDLTVTGYATWDDLHTYVHGSAEVIGLQMLPVLGTVPGQAAQAAAYAAELGVAFQLTNFIRDVGEDLRRGRVYLPQASLDLFGVTRSSLATGVVDGPVRRLLAFEIARCRELYRSAQHGVRLLSAESRPCIEVATTLYSGILDAVEAADHQVLDRRVSVPLPRRLRVAGAGLLRARRARQTPLESASSRVTRDHTESKGMR